MYMVNLFIPSLHYMVMSLKVWKSQEIFIVIIGMKNEEIIIQLEDVEMGKATYYDIEFHRVKKISTSVVWRSPKH